MVTQALRNYPYKLCSINAKKMDVLIIQIAHGKKIGIQCSMSCTKYNGVSCVNPTVPDASEEQHNMAEL